MTLAGVAIVNRDTRASRPLTAYPAENLLQ